MNKTVNSLLWLVLVQRKILKTMYKKARNKTNLNVFKKWREREYGQFMWIIIFCVFIVPWQGVLISCVPWCSVYHLLADPIYNDVRTSEKQNARESNIFIITQNAEKMKENTYDDDELCSFYPASAFFSPRFVKTHIPNSHYLQTQGRYIIITWRDANGKSGWFSFSRCSYVCDLI